MAEKDAAIVIQRWVRGHLCRHELKKFKLINVKQMRKFRRMISVCYGRLRTKLVKQVIKAIKDSKVKAGKIRAEMLARNITPDPSPLKSQLSETEN